METQENIITSNSLMRLIAEKIDHDKMKLERIEIYHPCDRFGLMIQVVCTRKDWEGFPYIVAEELLDEDADKKDFALADYEKLIKTLIGKLNEIRLIT